VSKLLNAKEASVLLRVTPRHVVERLRTRRGFPKALKPAREYLWHEHELIGWLNSTSSRV